MKILRFIALPVALLVSACVQPQMESPNNYATRDAMAVQQVSRCRVLDVQQVRLGAQPTRTGYGYYGNTTTAQTLQGPGAQTGAVLGTLLGAALGNEVSGGDQLVTTLIAVGGAAAGTRIGSNVDRNSPANVALEYSVINGKGQEMVIVQPYRQGDRVTQPGQSCRITQTASGARVLPAEHLPGSVNAPKTTRIN